MGRYIFSKAVALLKNTNENTDWDKVMMLYEKMENELERGDVYGSVEKREEKNHSQ